MSLLLLGVQFICVVGPSTIVNRFSLQQLIKFTPEDHPDMHDLKEGLKEISLVADFIDDQVKQFESQHLRSCFHFA